MNARHPEFGNVAANIRQSVDRENCEASSRPIAIPDYAGEYSLQEFVALALSQNPKIQAEKWKVDSAAWQIPVAASLEDPRLSVTALPAPIETAAGRQNIQVGISQKVSIREKQIRKEKIACAATQEARARLAAAERAVASDVRDAFAELLYRQEALEILDDERALLGEVSEIIVALYKTEKVSQQDIAQAELAELQIEQRLIAARLAMKNAQTMMARLVRVAPETPLRARKEPCLERLNADAQSLMNQAVASRPELHALIQRANQDRMTACLFKLDYIPDPTIGATWIGIGNAGISPVANGEDAVLLNFSMNLPVYRKRIEGKIKSAEARAISSVREYDDLRDETLRLVYDRFSQLESKLQLIDLLRDEIIPKAHETLTVSIKAYSVSKVDIQQVLESWQKLIRMEMSMRELERDYRRSMASLERVVGAELSTLSDCEITRLPALDQEAVPAEPVAEGPTEKSENSAPIGNNEENLPLPDEDGPSMTDFFRLSR
jgi:outer membrane protein TolC